METERILEDLQLLLCHKDRTIPSVSEIPYLVAYIIRENILLTEMIRASRSRTYRREVAE